MKNIFLLYLISSLFYVCHGIDFDLDTSISLEQTIFKRMGPPWDDYYSSPARSALLPYLTPLKTNLRVNSSNFLLHQDSDVLCDKNLYYLRPSPLQFIDEGEVIESITFYSDRPRSFRETPRTFEFLLDWRRICNSDNEELQKNLLEKLTLYGHIEDVFQDEGKIIYQGNQLGKTALLTYDTFSCVALVARNLTNHRIGIFHFGQGTFDDNLTRDNALNFNQGFWSHYNLKLELFLQEMTSNNNKACVELSLFGGRCNRWGFLKIVDKIISLGYSLKLENLHCGGCVPSASCIKGGYFNENMLGDFCILLNMNGVFVVKNLKILHEIEQRRRNPGFEKDQEYLQLVYFWTSSYDCMCVGRNFSKIFSGISGKDGSSPWMTQYDRMESNGKNLPLTIIK